MADAQYHTSYIATCDQFTASAERLKGQGYGVGCAPNNLPSTLVLERWSGTIDNRTRLQGNMKRRLIEQKTNRPGITMHVGLSPPQLPPRRNGAPSKSTSEDSKCRSKYMSGRAAPP